MKNIFQDTTTETLTASTLDKLQKHRSIGKHIKKIQASDKAADDGFGYSVAISDSRIIVGAPYEDTGASNAGAAYLFDIDGNEIKKITPSYAESDANFGYAVAISDRWIAIGEPGANAGADRTGNVSIYDIDGNVKGYGASEAEDDSYFGQAVSITNNKLAVGVPLHYDNAANVGAVFVYRIEENGNCTFLTKLQASDKTSGDRFGYSVAISDTCVVAGAPYATELSGYYYGAAYIFDMNFAQTAIITNSGIHLGDHFGWSVAASNSKIVVGAIGANGPADSGRAYIFDTSGTQLATLAASDASTSDEFGYSVAISNNRILVGARYEDLDGTASQQKGSAYIFDLNGTQIKKISARDPENADEFGRRVAISDTKIVVGTNLEDTGGSNAGAAYIYDAGFSPLGDLCAFYNLGNPTSIDSNFLWSNYT